MDNNIKWIKTSNRDCIGVKYNNNTGMYKYYWKEDSKITQIEEITKNPLSLDETNNTIRTLKYITAGYDLLKTLQIKQELEELLKEPEIKPDINNNYIRLELKKYNNDISGMLNKNIPEYVGNKTNLILLLLHTIAVKTGLKSSIINVNGISLSGKTTLIKTLFKLIPDELIINHNDSTLSGILRTAINNSSCYDNKLLYLGNGTPQRRNKAITSIEELIITLYKDHNNNKNMGAKKSSETATNVYIETKTFLCLSKSIEPRKSSNTEINDLMTYITVSPVPKKELFEELQIKNVKNNMEFIEQHKHYIDSLEDNNNIKEQLFNNKELIQYIYKNTDGLEYERLYNYEMLYCAYCIYLNVSPTIETFKQFQELTPEMIILTEQEQEFIKFLNKHYIDNDSILKSGNIKKFKYFSIKNLNSYHGTIKAVKNAGDLNIMLEKLTLKKKLKINSDGLYFLNHET